MKKLTLTLLSLVFCLAIHAQNPVDISQQIIAGRTNSLEQQKKPYVILISADGFRFDYIDKYKAEHLAALSKGGVRAQSMIPSFPSVTFPNHYTLVTGMYPSHHGLSQNDFYAPNRAEFYSMGNKEQVKDGSWYGGTPLWVLAEQQKMLSASFYWVASEAAIQGIKPTYYYNYNTKISIDDRIKAVVEWLKLPADRRPHLITFYFPEVDHEGHTYGPDAPETEKAVTFVDEAVYKMSEAVKATGLDVSFVFVSDHGMTRVDNEHTIPMPAVIDTNQFKIAKESTMIGLYANHKADIEPAYQKLKAEAKDYQVYLKKDMPGNLHFGPADDKFNTIGDILLIPNWPKIFQFRYNKKPNPGTHGFNPYIVKDMHATFLAWGPAFKSGLTVPSFENVNVYPIITGVLGLKITDKIDGTSAVAKQILR